ncbi:MAG: phosphomannomutase [Deltaproteobacteria bacterium]|jgi:phosphomannomutase|nr:phosphomannomutase [Deltaproteobacteria bacterium]
MNSAGVKSSFKAYDIRGRVPDELDAELCRDLGRALAAEFAPASACVSASIPDSTSACASASVPKKFRAVIGRDVRPSGLELGRAISRSLAEAGIEVVDIGVCGTEEIYFATGRHGFDLGIMLTASHNPAEYNGIKLVRAGAVPISGDSGLFALRDRILLQNFTPAVPVIAASSTASTPPTPSTASLFTASSKEGFAASRAEYVSFLLARLSAKARKSKLKLVMNPGNGCASYVLREIAPHLAAECLWLHDEPDGSFPNGVPNPLLPERRADTARAVLESGADLGLAWDGDFDRCFFYDGQGVFVESYYLIGLLAEYALREHPGGAVLHDTRLYWNTVERVRRAGGRPVMSKTGHAFMKESMRRENAVYGGEMSAHHYFRDFYFCDSGMLPWILLLNILADSGKTLAELVAESIKAFPCSGEINFRVADAPAAVRMIQERFAAEIKTIDHMDGLSADCGNWRFNLRSSNTEPLLRLNVESRGDTGLMQDRTANISEVLKTECGAN